MKNPFPGASAIRPVAVLGPALFVLASLVAPSPILALLAGVVFRLVSADRFPSWLAAQGGTVLKVSVVLLGFGLSLSSVLSVGRSSLLPSLASIVVILGLGWLLGRLFRVEDRLGFLVSGGTAICGGSAIASLAPAIGAGATETALSMAVVFTLNAVSLLVFPPVAALLRMDPHSYAVWCALGIHDTSSVAGAAAAMGPAALGLALSIKLTRSLWILPLSFAASRRSGRAGATRVPWYLLLFVAASGLASFLDGYASFWGGLAVLGRHLLVGAVFLVGTGVAFRELGRAGSAFLQGLVLWALSAAGLLAILLLWPARA